MRELRSCDFCGADAVGTFAIVPPELEPIEAEQRRVVCCGDCKDRLESLLEPLLARAGFEGAGTTATGATTSDEQVTTTSDEQTTNSDGTDSDGTDGDSGTVVASSNKSTQKRQRTSSPNATVSDAGGESDTEADDDPETGSGLEEGITFERAETEDDDTGDDTSEKVAADEPAETTGGDDSNETEASDSSAEQDASVTSDSSADESTRQSATQPPKAYGKVLRLLQNREFPMQRSAVSNLAAGAYDLETHEVDAIIDHAVAEGEFTEKRGKLHRS